MPFTLSLIGFMGSGKSTVGRIVAERLGAPFLDMDEAIALEAGQTIPAIFTSEGEEGFRRRERAFIEALSPEPRVLATGGGVVLDPRNLADLRSLGPVVALKAPASTLWKRVSGSDRPLASDHHSFLARYRQRSPLYAQVPLQVDASAAAEDVADAILKRIDASARRVPIDLGDRSYPVDLAPGLLSCLGTELRARLDAKRCLLVTNAEVGALYGAQVQRSLEGAGWQVHVATVPAGERYKSLKQAERLYEAALLAGLDRKSPIIALGGGVIGDLAGFVAATFQRGVPFVQVPTTLLAQIDSSVGGKVAVNLPAGKNLVGSFHQPAWVAADPLTLLSLPPRELRAGLAEMIKYGVSLDAAFLERVERDLDAMLAREAQPLSEAIARCCELKAAVVRADERETGWRAVLNFGHTVGHAVEALTNYRRYLHGEAVAIGMVAAAWLSVATGLSEAEVQRLEGLLTRAGLPTRLPDLGVEAILEAMGRDKKAIAGSPRFILLEETGRAVIQPVPEKQVREVLLRLGARAEG